MEIDPALIAQADQNLITQTWMLGIFGTVIVFLVGLLVSVFRQGARDNKESLKEIKSILSMYGEKLHDHEARLRVQESINPT